MGTEEIFPGRILKFGRPFERVEKNSISPRAILAVYTRACTRVRCNFLLKLDFFGTTHGDRPTSQNGISLRSSSLIMAPGK